MHRVVRHFKQYTKMIYILHLLLWSGDDYMTKATWMNLQKPFQLPLHYPAIILTTGLNSIKTMGVWSEQINYDLPVLVPKLRTLTSQSIHTMNCVAAPVPLSLLYNKLCHSKLTSNCHDSNYSNVKRPKCPPTH